MIGVWFISYKTVDSFKYKKRCDDMSLVYFVKYSRFLEIQETM